MDRQYFLVAALLMTAVSLPSHAATVDEARANALKWLVQTQKGDGSFSGLQGLETQATAASVEAMLAGCEFRRKLDSDSSRSWTVIPRQAGH